VYCICIRAGAHISALFLFLAYLTRTSHTYKSTHTQQRAQRRCQAHEALCWLADWSPARSFALYSHAVHTHTHSTPQFTYSIRFCLIYVRTCRFRMYFFMWHKQEYNGGNYQCISGYFKFISLIIIQNMFSFEIIKCINFKIVYSHVDGGIYQDVILNGIIFCISR
jgi:hypothetical protein